MIDDCQAEEEVKSRQPGRLFRQAASFIFLRQIGHGLRLSEILRANG